MTARCEPEHAAYPREAMAPHLRRTDAPHRVTVDARAARHAHRRAFAFTSGANRKKWSPSASAAASSACASRGPRQGSRRVTIRRTGGRGGNPRPIVSAPDGWLDPGARLFQRRRPRLGMDGHARLLAPARRPPAADHRARPVLLRPHARLRRQDRPAPRAPAGRSAAAQAVAPTSSASRSSPTTRSTSGRAISTSATTGAPRKQTPSSARTTSSSSAAANASANGGSERRARRRSCHRRAGAGGGGSLLFRGWRWLCPTCGRRCTVLYYPLPPVNVIRGYGTLLEDSLLDAAFDLDPLLRQPLRAPIPGLACDNCHGVTAISRAEPAAWNNIVSLPLRRPALRPRGPQARLVHPTAQASLPPPARPRAVQAPPAGPGPAPPRPLLHPDRPRAGHPQHHGRFPRPPPLQTPRRPQPRGIGAEAGGGSRRTLVRAWHRRTRP